MLLLSWGAFGDQGSALDPRRVFNPFETLFAILLDRSFVVAYACGWKHT